MADMNMTTEVASTEAVATPVEVPAVQQNCGGSGLVKAGLALGIAAIVGWGIKGAIWVTGKFKAKKAERQYIDGDVEADEEEN